MSGFEVKVVKGRQTFTVSCTPSTTVASVREQVEAQAGAVSNGLRFIYKGKSLSDTTTLASAGVKCGAKFMALPTATQRNADQRIAKTHKTNSDAAASDALREKQKGLSGSSARVSRDAEAVQNVNPVLGDAAVDGQTSVVVRVGHSKYRVNIDLSASVLELKRRAEGVEELDALARDMKVLFKRQRLADEMTLEECGVKDGAAVMVMFAARHHDAMDARMELDRIERELSELERKVEGCVKKARKRLLVGGELMLARGEVAEEAGRLRDNLVSVKGEDGRVRHVSERMENGVEAALEELGRIG